MILIGRDLEIPCSGGPVSLVWSFGVGGQEKKPREFIDLFSHLLALATLFNEGKADRCNKSQDTPENKG
jgi:hypothetical protein